MTAAASLQHDLISPFAGADVCRQAGLALPDQARRPVFEHDLWDFTDVVGLPVEMSLANRRFDFSAIADPHWRLVAKELMLAMLAPRHPAVATLPRAYRTPLHLRSCIGRLEEAIRFFGWLRRRGISDLAQIGTQDCEAYLAFRRYLTDEDGTVVGEQSPSVRRAAAQVVIDLVNYRELFTATRVRAGLRPWGGASASAVAEMPSGRTQNKTEPVAEEILQPMLAAALHLVTVLGPHTAELDRQVRQADRVSSVKAEGLRHGAPTLVEDVRKLLERDYLTAGTALPMLEDHDVAKRIAAGWSADDPLLPVATGVLARQAGYSQLWACQLPALRRHAAERRRVSRGAEDLRPERGRGPGRGRQQHTAVDLAAAPFPGRRPGRDRPHRGDHRRGRGLGHEGQRADGTARRLPPPGRGTGPRPAALPDRQQDRQGPAARRHRR